MDFIIYLFYSLLSLAVCEMLVFNLIFLFVQPSVCA